MYMSGTRRQSKIGGELDWSASRNRIIHLDGCQKLLHAAYLLAWVIVIYSM